MGGQLHVDFIPRIEAAADESAAGSVPAEAPLASASWGVAGRSSGGGSSSGDAQALAFKLMRGTEGDCYVCLDDDANAECANPTKSHPGEHVW